MSAIVAQNVNKSYGARVVLGDVSLRLDDGQRVGLVGPNGEGKTTLLRLLGGLDEPTSGAIARRRNLRVGYLPQDPPDLGGVTLWENALAAFADLQRMETELHRLADKLAANPADGRLLHRYGALQADFEHRDGYTCETRVRSTLEGLGFGPAQYNQPLSQMSGGQRSRALLAGLLLQEPDVLLLDEPTNHLDLDAVEWLEKWLQSFPGALVVVSHDRYLLDKAAQYIWEVAFAEVETYRGNYSASREQRELRRQERQRQYEAQQEYIAKTEEYIRRYHAAQRAKEARGRRTRLERFVKNEAIGRRREHKQISVRFGPVERAGDLVLRAADLVVGYDAAAPLLRVPDLEVERGRRVAIIGPNGSGKTSLLRTLLGDLPPLAGEVRRGANVEVGYLPQTHDALDPAMTVLDAVLEVDPQMTPVRARHLLGALLFHGDDVFKTIGEISGGQRSRVVLARLVARGANLLCLDEPTNHLDIPSQEILQDVLQNFGGTVILVSHDRYLVQALATHVWMIEKDGFYNVKGDWEAFLRWRSERVEHAQTARQAEKAEGQNEYARRKELGRLRKRLEKLEGEIHAREARLHELTDEISRAGLANEVTRVAELGRTYEQVRAELDGLWDQYGELAERVE